MKFFLLLLFFTATGAAQAQTDRVGQLPAGTYQVQRGGSASSLKGDIVLLDDSHYKLSNESTEGEYKFSATAQRLLFMSGTLKGAFARTVLSGSVPAIVMPRKENEDIGFKLVQADLQAFYKRN